MKYTIEGFNQAYATTLTAETTINGKTITRKIDCTDLVLLRWFVDFYPKMKKVEIDGKQYAFVSHKKVLDDIPILGVTPKAIIDRMKKMVFFGILDYKFLKDNGSISVYGFGENYIHLVESPIQQQTTGYANNEGGSSSNVYPVAVQTNTDYSIIDNSIISKENIKRNENIVQPSFLANDGNQVQNEKVDLETVTPTTTSSLIATNEQPSSRQKANKGTDTETKIEQVIDFFDKTYSLYPRKVSRGRAQTTFIHKVFARDYTESRKRALYIYKCLERQIVEWANEGNGKGRGKDFMPYMSSWLNDNFEDVPKKERGKIK